MTGQRTITRFLGVMLAALLGLAGCRNMDEFSIKKMNFEVFRDPDNPLEVIRSSKDGNERARALRSIREPSASGGSKEEQDAVLAVLNYSASHESQVWCRVAAIDSLRKFKDPRAAEGLKEAYYRAGAFQPETASMVRCVALAGLGETGQPAAVEMLVRIVREPPVEGADQDRELKLRERISAAKALGNFKHYQAATALVEVLKKEQNDALRNNAQQSLVAMTGKDLPADAQVWSEFLQNPKSSSADAWQPKFSDRMLQLTGMKQ